MPRSSNMTERRAHWHNAGPKSLSLTIPLFLTEELENTSAMAQSPPQSFIGRVRDSLPALHPTERRLAEFVLDFPGEIASYSASELAQLANVSNATVSRFIRRLGYSGYDDARRSVRTEKGTGSAEWVRVLRGVQWSGMVSIFTSSNLARPSSTVWMCSA